MAWGEHWPRHYETRLMVWTPDCPSYLCMLITVTQSSSSRRWNPEVFVGRPESRAVTSINLKKYYHPRVSVYRAESQKTSRNLCTPLCQHLSSPCFYIPVHVFPLSTQRSVGLSLSCLFCVHRVSQPDIWDKLDVSLLQKTEENSRVSSLQTNTI